LLLNGSGEFQLAIGSGAPASAEDGFDSPAGLAVDEDDNLYVSDTGNGVVKKYSPLGILLKTIGQESLRAPHGVSVDLLGRIFVSDFGERQVSVFSPDGSALGTIRDPGFEEPHVVRTDGNELYVLDRLAGMLVFEADAVQAAVP
jgi:sugar lactone lactonase YvrE